jgi:hypothetical protein
MITPFASRLETGNGPVSLVIIQSASGTGSPGVVVVLVWVLVPDDTLCYQLLCSVDGSYGPFAEPERLHKVDPDPYCSPVHV